MGRLVIGFQWSSIFGFTIELHPRKTGMISWHIKFKWSCENILRRKETKIPEVAECGLPCSCFSLLWTFADSSSRSRIGISWIRGSTDQPVWMLSGEEFDNYWEEIKIWWKILLSPQMKIWRNSTFSSDAISTPLPSLLISLAIFWPSFISAAIVTWAGPKFSITTEPEENYNLWRQHTGYWLLK